MDKIFLYWERETHMIKIIAVGKIKEKFVKAQNAEY